jgi:toxin ParE1/3/4
MRVLWTPAAADDLEKIADYLLEKNPAVATEIVRRIYKALDPLKRFKVIGRPGRKRGTRELVVSLLPYVIVYEVTGQAVRVTRILHGAQRWP